jgi:hypothetical protein
LWIHSKLEPQIATSAAVISALQQQLYWLEDVWISVAGDAAVLARLLKME